MPEQLSLNLRTRPCRRTRFGYDLNAYDREIGRDEYEPRECRRRILDATGDQWVGFIELVHVVRMKVQPVNDMLCRLVKWGRLERHELYFGEHTSEDRLTRPPLERQKLPGGKLGPSLYHGFEWGYRRRRNDSTP